MVPVKSLVDEEKGVMRVEYSPLVKELSGIISLENDVNLRVAKKCESIDNEKTTY